MLKAKSTWSLMVAGILALGLTACSDPDDQRGDPTDPTQEAPTTERDERREDIRDERSVTQAVDRDEDIDPAADPMNQPTPARTDLLAGDISHLGDTADPTTVRTHQQEHTELEMDIREYVRHAEADDIKQCALIPFGHKPCGGPESYLVYSQRDLSSDDIADLEEKVARYNHLDAFLKAAQGMMSTCDVTPEPIVTIESGRCVAQSHSR